MKVIITGCTGLVGGALVRECLANTRITHVFLLTRKLLPAEVTNSPKATVILHDDFGTYPAHLLAKLAGAEGCLWAIGGMVNKFPDVETARKVGVDYTLAAANAFMQLGQGTPDHKFRFVYCSGRFSEWDQNKWLPFLGDTRRIKGQVEKGLCDLADANKDSLEVWAVRPADIMHENTFIGRRLVAKLMDGIEVGKLAAVMVKILLDGYEQRLIDAAVLIKIGDSLTATAKPQQAPKVEMVQ